ncbi:MAG TPA: PepSY-associated TM helix domain-containing protein [Bryobacteraceae bacterium]|nr:PepSY-associated TM helix domain-containing protein [Bryobacteraceae bacterium]
MPSLDDVTPAKPCSRRVTGALEVWNRKAHYYVGLYLLFFVWLFALTGLLLNHPEWTFADFWPTRKQSSFERHIQRPPAGSDLAQAKNVLDQLGLAGEIEWTEARAESERLNFRASRPGRILEIESDFAKGLASVHRIDVNAWGVMRMLHTFTGVRIGDARNQRDWFLSVLWAFAMDAVALGLIVMVLGSYYMWWRLSRKRTWGAVALSLGVLACGLFVVGLRLIIE